MISNSYTYRKEYDAVEGEFAVPAALIRARTKPGLRRGSNSPSAWA